MDATIIDMDKGRTSGDGMEQEEPTPKVEQKTITAAGATTPTADDGISCNATKSTRPPLRRKDSAILQEQRIHAPRKNSTASSSGGGAVGVAAGVSAALPLPGLHTLYRRPEVLTRSLAPLMPKGELVHLKPRLVTSANAAPLPEHKKTKAPKFIPYEPYPGAVNPIVPLGGQTTPRGPQKLNKNNLDISVLVRQMSTMRTQELAGDVKPETTAVTGASLSSDANEVELQTLRDELKTMKGERDYFQGQFKFQTQVNSELKNLLVASVGEDLQTRVNLLTEDKLQLARALLDTANNLTTHTEQIEFLAGQCEVWRSKFLASSVMVEELARWKADLSQKNQMLNEATKRLLHSTHQMREIQLESLKHLKFLAKIRYLNLPATDVISLGAENLNILQQMVLHSGVGGIPEANLNISSASTNPLCESEKYAVEALEFISQPLMATDDAIRALFGQAQRPYGVVVNSAALAEAQLVSNASKTN